MHAGQPLLRVMRAAVFAVVCVLVSAFLHGLAGGAPVRPGTLAGALALTWAGAFLLGARPRGMGVLLGACFAAQYGMHHLFSASGDSAVSALPAHQHGTGLGMLLVHAVVAAGSAWRLERGESALAMMAHLAVTSLAWLWDVLRALAPVLGEVETGPRLGRWTRVRARRWSRLFTTAVARRGPPAFLSLT